MGGLTVAQWIQWLLATFVAGITIAISQTTYVHTTFAKITDLMLVKSDIKKQQERDVDLVLKRLDSLEHKVDRIIERGQR